MGFLHGWWIPWPLVPYSSFDLNQMVYTWGPISLTGTSHTIYIISSIHSLELEMESSFRISRILNCRKLDPYQRFFTEAKTIKDAWMCSTSRMARRNSQYECR